MDQAWSAVFGWGSSRWLDSRRGVARPGVRGEEATLDVRVRGRGEGPGDVCADDGRGLGRGEDATMPAHSAALRTAASTGREGVAPAKSLSTTLLACQRPGYC